MSARRHGRGEGPAADKFWALADGVIGDRGVAEGTLMGGACLRVNGDFLATYYSKDDSMIVKLDADRVAALVATGAGLPFAPANRVFKEWVAIPFGAADEWPALLDEAITRGNE